MKTLKDLEARARSAISRDENFIYDVAVEHGQIVDNVKHMKWFVEEVMKYLAENFPTWQHLQGKV